MRNANIYILLMSVLMAWSTCITTQAQEPNTQSPLQWKVGDSWKVRTWSSTIAYMTGEDTSESQRKAHPFEVLFNVQRIVSLDMFRPFYRPSSLRERSKDKYKKLKRGEYKFFEIQVTYPKESSGFQSRFLLYFRKDTKNLVRIRENSIKGDGSAVSMRYDYPIDPNAPVFTRHVASMVCFDWPNWQKAKVAVEEKEKKGISRLKTQEIKDKSYKDAKGKSFDGYEVTMKHIHKKEDTEKVWLKSTQKWKKNAKWWSQAVFYDEGTKWTFESELIEEE